MFALAAITLLTTRDKITIKYESSSAKAVALAGDLNGWGTPKPMSNSNGIWTFEVDIPQDSRFEYKFVVDGNWVLDPKNPNKIDNSIGGENSVFAGTQYKLNVHDQQPNRPMIRTSFNVDGREIVIFAPKQSKKLPILLYGDGQNYEKYGRIENIVENLVETRKIRPVILVLVPPSDRMKEYGQDWKNYANLLFYKILPEARKLTGASTRAEDLYLGGSSLGGVISLRLAEEFPNLVAGGVHSQSGAFQFPNAGELVSQKGIEKLARTTRLWLCWGNFEDGLTKINEKAVKTLTEMKHPFGSRITNEGHNWTAWRHRMEDGLIYLLGSKQAKRP